MNQIWTIISSCCNCWQPYGLLPREESTPEKELELFLAKHTSQESKLGDKDLSEYAIKEAECLICLETFSPSNPSMPVLCSCGENRIQLHYACRIPALSKLMHLI